MAFQIDIQWHCEYLSLNVSHFERTTFLFNVCVCVCICVCVCHLLLGATLSAVRESAGVGEGGKRGWEHLKSNIQRLFKFITPGEKLP